ncbi:MAG TPA: flagellar biosynthesis anti-sigma factor FlgM [Gammaproteobacteria bacterium]|nr:flagellar biosynthesis anti-sigma factor FlgM [Gammaproteobacteria bacterium]
MNSKINNLFPQGPQNGRAAASNSPAREAPGARRSEAPAARPSDEKVTLTEAARTFASLPMALSAEPVVDEAKVSQLREAVQAGLYKPDPQAIADALIRSDEER